jgi:hypothetical protein
MCLHFQGGITSPARNKQIAYLRHPTCCLNGIYLALKMETLITLERHWTSTRLYGFTTQVNVGLRSRHIGELVCRPQVEWRLCWTWAWRPEQVTLHCRDTLWWQWRKQVARSCVVFIVDAVQVSSPAPRRTTSSAHSFPDCSWRDNSTTLLIVISGTCWGPLRIHGGRGGGVCVEEREIRRPVSCR